MPSVERRKWPRVALEREIVVYAAGQRVSCRAVDISAGGVCLLPPVQGDPGLLLRLNIGFSNGHTVAVDGVVVREGKVGSRYAWGVRFHRVAAPIQKQLAEQVAVEERHSAGDHVPARRVSTGRGHPRVRGGGEGAAGPKAAREAVPQREPLPREDPDDDYGESVGEYKQIGRGTRERVAVRDLPQLGGGAQRTAGLRDPRQVPTRSPTGPAYPQVGGQSQRSQGRPEIENQRSQSRWEIDLMGSEGPAEEPAGDAPGVKPMRPLVPTGPHRAVGGWSEAEAPRASRPPTGRVGPRPVPARSSPRDETGPGYAAVRGPQRAGERPPRRASAPETGPAHPAQRDPELEQAIGDELESLLRAAMEKLDDER